jgi:hypothetical protein
LGLIGQLKGVTGGSIGEEFKEAGEILGYESKCLMIEKVLYIQQW